MKKKFIPILIFVGLLLLMFVFSSIPALIFNIELDLLSPGMNILYNLCCDVGLIIIIFLIYYKRMIDEFKDLRSNFKKYFKIMLKYYLIGFGLMIISNIVISVLFNDASSVNNDMVKDLLSAYPYYMVFSILVYAPMVEETVFRRALKDGVLAFKNNKFTRCLYIILSGFIFGLLHVLGSASSLGEYLYIIPYIALGTVFAIIYVKTDNLYTTIICHAIHNLIALILFFTLGV